MPRITQYYGILEPVPFEDVNIEVDNKIFVDPHAIRLSGYQPFASQAQDRMTSFFDAVLHSITSPAGSAAHGGGEPLLQRFSEPRETRLGMARGGSDGHGAAEILGSEIWTSLTTDLRALVEVAVLRHLEHLSMFVPGIDRDITSDITTRIIYDVLAEFTATMVNRYPQFRSAGHRLVTDDYQVWDPAIQAWTERSLELPAADGKPLLLVPRGWARPRLLMSAGRYYDTSVLTYAQVEQAVLLQDKLVRTPKDRLKQQPELARGRTTNARVTLRAQTKDNDLVGIFTRFVDTRYDPPSLAA